MKSGIEMETEFMSRAELEMFRTKPLLRLLTKLVYTIIEFCCPLTGQLAIRTDTFLVYFITVCWMCTIISH